MEKKDLLKAKKALLVAAMSTMTLTACAPTPEVKGEKRVQSNELFQDNIYLNENNRVVIEVQPEKHISSNGIYYTVPDGYTLMYDENGKPFGRKIISKTR